MPAPESPPVLSTIPPVIVIGPADQFLCPKPIPAAPLPPCAMTSPPLIVMDPNPLSSPSPPPIPAAYFPPVHSTTQPFIVRFPPIFPLVPPIPGPLSGFAMILPAWFRSGVCAQIVRSPPYCAEIKIPSLASNVTSLQRIRFTFPVMTTALLTVVLSLRTYHPSPISC